MNPAQLRCTKRWYPLKEHPEQLRLIRSPVRFKVVPAGRRSGKTERLKRFIAKAMMSNPGKPYFLGAPTRQQVKKIYWEDMKLLCFTPLLHRDCVSESELVIRLPNQSSVTLIGLDKPQRMEGTFWAGGGIDEIADVKETAWAENISPALDTFDPLNPDYRPWCWLIGVPDGLNHYYERADYAANSGDPDWDLFTWHSEDILPPDIIEAAKRRLSKRQYRQEYGASFETASGRIYEDYGKENLCNEEIRPHEQILWCHDFNYTPMSSAVVVKRGGDYYILDEVVLESAVSKQSAQEFVERYSNHQNKNILLYGDPAGKAGEKHGHQSDYTAMEKLLRQHGWTVTRKVRAKAPAIVDRQNAVRAFICNAADERRLFINPNRAEYAHKGFQRVQLKEGSTFLEAVSKYQHITTAVGYMIEYNHPIQHTIDEIYTGQDLSDELDYSLG